VIRSGIIAIRIDRYPCPALGQAPTPLPPNPALKTWMAGTSPATGQFGFRTSRPRAQLDFPGPGAALLAMQVEIAVGDRVGIEQRVGAAIGAARVARPADPAIADDMADMDSAAADRAPRFARGPGRRGVPRTRGAPTPLRQSMPARVPAWSFLPRQKRCRCGAGEPLSYKKNVENQPLLPPISSSKKPQFGLITERVWRITGAKTSRLCAKQLVRSSPIPAQRFRLTDNAIDLLTD